MRVGNGSKVNVIAVGTLPLHLPSGLVLNLNNCYLVPALSMNIVSGSRLIRDGYSFKSENNGCSYMGLSGKVRGLPTRAVRLPLPLVLLGLGEGAGHPLSLPPFGESY